MARSQPKICEAVLKLPQRRRVVDSWRALTGGKPVPDADRRTLVACSGGADSSALALLLADRDIVLAHVVHDLRPANIAWQDARATEALAADLGVPCAVTEVRVGPGNAESQARRARYAALATLAAVHGCRFVATAHHADDALETILLRLVRGCGPGALAGLRPRRPLTPGVELIRPMLVIDRAAAEEVCRAAGLHWREDSTNLDTRRARALLRTSVLPALRQLSPQVARRAIESARLAGDAAVLVDAAVASLMEAALTEPGAITLRRDALAAAPSIVAGAALRACARGLGEPGHDRRRRRDVHDIIRSVNDHHTHPRRWVLGGIRVELSAHALRLSV